MSDSTTPQDDAAMSPASTGSVADDPLSVCCRHLANSQHIIEEKNAEIYRLRLTDAEREAVHQAAIRFDGLCQMCAKDRAATLRGLLERLGG